jgi:hypothetical protein
MKPFSSMSLLLGLFLLVSIALPRTALAHCDSLDGPVVNAARAALADGDVDHVLIWVLPEQQQDIQDAFARTLRVRALGDEAAELADYWFFETVVRLHRESEGAPYTGLKPPGWQPPALVAAADRVLLDGEIDDLGERVSSHVRAALHERYDRVRALESFEPSDVPAGRRYVAAYVDYVHFLEGIHHVIHGHGDMADHH